ncbi:MAG TPA: NB-ARC domain-containing protein [Streptosporangiaceae bacterium]|nr:NB-ARC domain-containing protein [Streptosporangiaceae bacterium]
MGDLEPGPRQVFSARLTQLLDLAGLKLEVVAARANKRIKEGERWEVTAQRLSDWRRGEHLPASDAAFQSVIRVLIENCRGRVVLDADSKDLLSEDTWRRLLRSARKSSPSAGQTQGGTSLDDRSGSLAAGTFTGLLPPPPSPELFCARPGLHRSVVESLKSPEGGRAPIVAMVGMGGSGKTLLAQAIAADDEVKAGFPDGVLWLDVGDTPEAVCQATVLAAFGRPALGGSVMAGKTALRQTLAGARVLLILDDVTRPAQVTALDVLGPGCVLLATTRDEDTLPHGTHKRTVGAFEVADPAGRAAALSLLAQYAGSAEELSAAAAGYAEEVVAGCGGLPLALATCGAMASGGYSWASIVALLRDADLGALQMAFRDYPHPSLLAAIAVGANALDERTLSLYEELAVFSARGPVPVAAAETLWAAHGLNPDHSLRTIVFLARRSLLTYRPDNLTFTLHDLQYDYVAWRLGQRLAAVHGRLADTYLAAWGRMEDGLPRLITHDGKPSEDMRYGLVHVPDHLVRAGRDDQLHRLLAAETRAGAIGSGNAWFDAHDRLGRTAEYLADINLAGRRAEETADTARTPAQRSLGLGLQVRYALVRSSLASIAGEIPGRLLSSLVRQRVWSAAQARAYAAMIPDDEHRAAALTGLAGLLKPGTGDRAQLIALALQAAAGIKEPMYRAFAYARIAVVSPEEDRPAMFDQAEAAADAASGRAGEIRAWLQTYVAPYYPERAAAELRRGARSGHHTKHYRDVMTAVLGEIPDLREDVLETARRAYFRGERGEAFEALLRCAQPDQVSGLVTEIKAAIEGEDKEWREEELVVAVAPYLPSDELNDLVTRLTDGASPHTVITLMAAALPHLPADRREAAVSVAVAALRSREGQPVEEKCLTALLRSIPEPGRTALLEEHLDLMHNRHPASAEWLLCALAPTLPEHLLRRAVDGIGLVHPPEEALNRLAPHLKPELLRRALAVRHLDSSAEWAAAFVHLAPALPGHMREQVLDLVSAVEDIPRRLELLSQLTPSLPPELCGPAAEAIPADAEPEPRARLLAALASRAPEPQRTGLDRHARDIAESANYPHADFRGLVGIADGPEQLEAVLRLQCTLDGFGNRHIRRECLDEESLSAALVDHAVKTARTMEGQCDRARALAMLVPLAATASQPALLMEAAEGTFQPHPHIDDIPCDALRALKAAVKAVPVAARPPLARKVTDTLAQPEHNPERLRQLIVLAVYQSGIDDNRQVEALACIAELTSRQLPDWVRRHGTSGFRRLAPYLSQDRMLDAVRLAQALDEPDEQMRALADLAENADSKGLDPMETPRQRGSGRARRRPQSGNALNEVWSPQWRTALHNAAGAGRPALLSFIARMPILAEAEMATGQADSTAALIARAMFDTRRWWPAGP